MFAAENALKISVAMAVACAIQAENVAFGVMPLPAVAESVMSGGELVSTFAEPALPWSIAQQPRGEDTSPFMASVERVAARSNDPARARRSLLLAMRMSTKCYAPDISQQELDELIAATGLRPKTLVGRQDRFDLSSTIWNGNALLGPSGKSIPARLTYSFAPDAALWGNDADFLTLPNSLNATLVSNFGLQDVGREWIRQGLAAWKHVAGVQLDEVGDNGIAMDLSPTRRSTVGDIRIGGNPLIETDGGTDLAGVLAYNFFPASGGDMLIDTNEFTASRFNNAANNFRYFRNVVAHEHGHGLGFIHQVPCNSTKLMEPLVSTSYDVLQVDDKRGAGFGYGDRFSGNSTAATAADLGTIRLPALPARLIRDLSIARQNNGPTSGPNVNEPNAVDWFKFTINTAQSIVVIMTPTGGTYSTGAQQADPNDADNACFGSSGSINATSVIDLDLELRGTDGTTILASAAAGAGATDSVSQFLNPGTYFIRVFSFLPDPGANVQLYNLQVGVAAGLHVPEANAGINKRVNVGEICQFIGDVNTIPGVLPINSYQWDLDGNGSVDIINPRPSTIYTTPGIRRVELTVVDSNNGNGVDAINVTVIGSPPVVNSVSPSTVAAGTTVPITINGSFLGSPTVSVSAFGIAVSGTPSVDLTNPNSPITGLSLVVDPLLPVGPRDVTVTTPSGTVTLSNAINVVQPPTTITSIVPSSGAAGQTVPIVINGTNFRFANFPTITGTGATLSGTPSVNGTFTQITGLSVVIAPNAPTGPRTISVSALGGIGSATFTVTPPPLSNDLCSNALPIALGSTLNGTNVGAQTEGSVATGCASSTISDVFYSFSADCAGSYRFETGPATLDTVLSVHTACPASAANAIACSDDITPGSNLGSRVDVNLNASTIYIIRVSSFGGRPTGAFTLTAMPTTPLPNDVCANAINLPVGATNFDTCFAASEPTVFTSCNVTGKDVWYSFTADRAGRTTIQTCGSTFDTILEVFTSACGTSDAAIACSDDSCGTRSSVSFVAALGTTYRVRVSGYFGFGSQNFGAGTLTRYCPADINLSSAVTVQDIFDFLAAWFVGAPSADFNGVSGVTVQDIFDFLSGWFQGC